MSTPGATYPPPPGTGRWGRAARDAWSVQVRCQAVLGGLALAATAFVAAAMDIDSAGLMAFVWLAHAVIALVVGYPVGVVVGRMLPPDPTRASGWWFALAGAVAGAAIMLATGPGAAVLYAGLGAAVAGGARVWAQGAIERRHAGLLPVA